MGKFTFIIGGLRSGKSCYAQDLARKIGGKTLFIATCVPHDEEMRERIILHKKSRPHFWKTIEEPKNLKTVLVKLKNTFNVVIIDCLGLFISNLLFENLGERKIEKEIKSIVKILANTSFTSIVVSNEVGSGLVPTNFLARKFSDILGLTNQLMAKKSG